MNQGHVKTCNYCKQQIRMTEKLGHWYPLNLDNGYHRCDSKKEVKQEEEKPQLKNLLEAQMKLEELTARVKRLEQIVIDPRPRK